MAKRMSSGVLWIKGKIRQLGTTGEIYLFNIFLLMLAFVMIATILNNRFSQRNISYIMDYNYSALKGIDNLLDQQEREFMNIVNGIYIDASEENSLYSCLVSDGGDLKQQFQHPITSFMYDISTSSFSAQAVYHADQGIAYVRKDGKIEIYEESNQFVKGMKAIYEDPKSHLLMTSSTFSNNKEAGRSYAMIYGIREQLSYTNVGAIQIEFKTKMLDLLLKNSYPDVIGDFLIVDKDGEVFYDTTGKWYGKTYTDVSLLLESKDNSKGVTLSDGKYYVNSLNKGVEFYHDLHVFGIVSYEEANTERIETLTYIVSILVIIFLLFSIATFMNIYKKTIVLKRIYTAMKSVQMGMMDVSVNVSGIPQSELTDIANAFNEMVMKLNDHIKKQYQMKMEQQEYKLKALQAQLNPHFLYNSFESIRMKAMISGNQEIEEMILLLSKILRNAVKGESILPIAMETQNCRNYLQFHKIRFKEQLSYDIDIPEEIENYAITCQAMQVIIENYIVHSFDISRDDNYIFIVGKKEGDWITITISDNSRGVTQDKVAEMRRIVNNVENVNYRNHIGLGNVSQSMRIIFGESFRFMIDLLENGGLSQTICFRAYTLEEIRDVVQSDNSRR